MSWGKLLTAMITPFHPDGSVDYDGAAQLASHLIDAGNDGVVVSGTTGESPTLTLEEKLGLYRCVVEAVGGRASVIAGTGSYCTRESVELTRQAEAAGVHGVMLVVPYYNNPPQEGLYRHFRTIAEATSLPVLLYNVPSRAPRNLEANTVIRLAEIENIVAVKEASGLLEQVTEIISRAPDGFHVYSGDDSSTLPLLSLGAWGVVSVAGHVAGRRIREMIDSFVAGETGEAARIHGELLPLFRALFCTTNPIPVKAGVEMLGLPAGPCRLPLVDADEGVRSTVARALREAGLVTS